MNSSPLQPCGHRSHFGSRYTLGSCCKAGLLYFSMLQASKTHSLHLPLAPDNHFLCLVLTLVFSQALELRASSGMLSLTKCSLLTGVTLGSSDACHAKEAETKGPQRDTGAYIRPLGSAHCPTPATQKRREWCACVCESAHCPDECVCVCVSVSVCVCLACLGCHLRFS